ncbi:hypothetical protein [Mariniradius sediminis]|jgi:hypothetical protein|uniref:Uncharacterized protein n=1 Tax=Mariniradius sediminis TaxID=2909237 RepID=A0ABS9BVW8_9BACT|nr:hypothetical protein [Mariniradius sediminis]MCF1752214.1 hypothetical protein [Mariniradius sediminis]
MDRLFLETNISDKGRNSTFGREFIFVCRFFSRFLSEVRIENLSKILIEIIEPPQKAYLINTHKLTRVASARRFFNWKMIEEESSDKARFRIILDFLQFTVQELCNEFGWPVEGFDKAYSEVIRSDFRNEYVILTPKNSKNRKLSALVKVSTTTENNAISAEIFSKHDKKFKRKIHLTKCVFYKDDFSDLVKMLHWETDDLFIVSNKNKEIHFRVSVKEEKSEIVLSPRINSRDYLIEELKLSNPETSDQEANEILSKRLRFLFDKP